MENQDNFTTSIATRCSQGLRDSLEELASRDHRALGNYVRKVLEDHVREVTAEKETAEEPRAA